MITCLDNLIGVRGLAGEEDPDSGRFLNDLAGITTQKLEDISDQEDHYEPRLAWDDIKTRAAAAFENDVKTNLRPFAVRYNYIGKSFTGQLDIDNETLPTEAFYNGWEFDLVGLDPDKSIVFETITLHIVSGNNFDVRVFDAITGEILFEDNFTVTTGLNTYRILFSVPIWQHRRIFIAYDATTITVKKVDRFDRRLSTATAGHVSTAGDPTFGNITSADTGMILTYNVECSVDNFTCQRIDLFTNPILFKHGIEFCNEQIYSDRINRWTTLDNEDAKDLRDNLFIPEYKEMMLDTFKDIRLGGHHSDCFRCAKPITYQVQIP